jgi:ubiquitin-like 1-activating enzyme E1 B
MSRATLKDLVEDFLQLELGYGEELVVNHGDNLLYDPDETENLARKLSELGMLTVPSKITKLTTLFRYQGR